MNTWVEEHLATTKAQSARSSQATQDQGTKRDPIEYQPLFKKGRRRWLTKGEISSPWLYRLLRLPLIWPPVAALLALFVYHLPGGVALAVGYTFFGAVFLGQLWLVIVMAPLAIVRNARYRYFHNGTLGKFEAAQQVASNAERYALLLAARDFLFQQRRSGRLFQARWKQNLALFVSYSVVHRTVRQCEGRLPPAQNIIAEYRSTMARMSEYQHLTGITDQDIRQTLDRVAGLYQRCSHAARSTFFPIGELARAIDQDARAVIYPYLFGNQEEHDLGLVLDAIFNIAMLFEDAHHDAPQATQLVGVRELAECKEYASRLMHFEQRFI